MTLKFDFPEDAEFTKLIRREREANLTIAALEIARDAQPGLDFQPTLEWIDRRAAEVRGLLAHVREPREQLETLASCLSGTHGLHGTTSAYDQADASYLNRVISTGTGLPISLSLVWQEVASAAGIRLQGVSAPLQFLLRMETDLGPLFVDAFRGGVVLDWDECLEWLVELSELEASEIEPMMAPARPREVITRMLNNLKVLHVKHGEWEMAHQVQKRLTALLPGRFDQHRDLGLIAFKARHYGLAVQLLEDCLRTCEGSERSVLTRHWQEAVRCLSERN
ncbi:MAG: hypothetical protein C0478_09720 [Planctomyces sp.]|nr:hypothetical protein [Planctomyces sp.]